MPAATAVLYGVDGAAFNQRDLNGVGNNVIKSYHKLGFVAGDYAAGGIALSIAEAQKVVPSGTVPISINFIPNGSYAAGDLSGIGGRYVYNPVSGKVSIWIANGTQYSTGALGADVTADEVIVEVNWRKLSGGPGA